MGTAESRFDERALDIRRRAACTDSDGLDLLHLVRLATLAASSHNTQPWKFVTGEARLRIIPDLSRRCPVVDPDDSHLFKSLGCALENVVQGAAAQGHAASVGVDPESGVIDVAFRPEPGLDTGGLHQAIPQRQCTRGAYDGMALATSELAELVQAGQGPGVRVQMKTSGANREALIGFVSRGNTAQLTDRAFRRELVEWIRFSPGEALQTGDGLAGRCTGQPAIPRWLGASMSRVLLRPGGQITRDARFIRSSAGIAVFVSTRDDRTAWIETGRSFQRFALRATLMDVRTAFINQPIEVRQMRAEFETWLGLRSSENAQLVVRFGRGPLMPFSLRRPLNAVFSGPRAV